MISPEFNDFTRSIFFKLVLDVEKRCVFIFIVITIKLLNLSLREVYASLMLNFGKFFSFFLCIIVIITILNYIVQLNKNFRFYRFYTKYFR